MTDTLANKVALVTGGGRGIGRGVSRFLAKEGAKVVVNDPGVSLQGSESSPAPADQVVTEIQELGGDAIANYQSVTEFAAGQDMVQQAIDTYGRLDIVVTCAGILRDRMIFNMSEEEWDDVIRVHLKGTFNVVRHASSVMKDQRSGRIVTFSSTSGLYGNVGQANYGAAKSGIAGLTKVIARDLGRYGVTANSIAPRAATRMTLSVPDAAVARRASAGIMRPQDRDGVAADFDPDDIAPFVAYLASDHAANVNGQTFLVYGNTVTLLSQPRLEQSILKPDGFWSYEELEEIMPTLTRDLTNPAPPSA
jgi:NAD(P)-dependent dehydrogenase (short-subunit alcohol dehydrogenase family)